MKDKLYSISIAIPTFNEENNIKNCLDSIFRQDYPNELLEVIIVDGNSLDNTVKIARDFQVKILNNDQRDPEVGKMLALGKCDTELFMYLDADAELAHRDWFLKMVRPLMEHSEIVASFTRYLPRRSQPAINRFLSYDPLQCDPVYEFFSTNINKTVREKKKDFYVCEYTKEKIPPAAMCLFRRKILWTQIKNMPKFMDLDNLVILVKKGFNKFAYVPETGIYHVHVDSLSELLKKRLRNLHKVYLPSVQDRHFRWFKLNSFLGIFKILFWVFYVHLLIPELIRGIFKSFKYRDIACLYQPLVSLVLTDGILAGFIFSKTGRRFLIRSLFFEP